MISFLDFALTACAEPIARALVHFLWQGSLVALILGGVLLLLRGQSPRLRYGFACAALLLMVLLPVITAIQVAGRGPNGRAETQVEAMTATTGATSAEQESSPPPAQSQILAPQGAAPARALQILSKVIGQSIFGDMWPGRAPWIVGFWLAGVLIISAVHLGGWWHVQKLRRLQTEPVPARWQECVNRYCQRLDIRQTVRVLRSALVEVPAVIGWLRPVVLIPVSAISGFAPRQLECILAHELAHIIRRDYLVNLLQVVAETMLFYHPAVWWVSRQIRTERENCCDDIAVGLAGDRLAYARALVDLEEMRQVSPRLALGANDGSLLRRVHRLVGGQSMSNEANRTLLPGVLVVSLLLIGGVVLGMAAQAGYDGQVDPVTILASGGRARPAPASFAQPEGGSGQVPAREIIGRWSAERENVELHLELRSRGGEGDRWNMSLRVPVKDFRNLKFSEGDEFSLQREAGTFHFEGNFEGNRRDSAGDGTFTFTRDRRYVDRLRELGSGDLDDHELLVLAVEDLRIETVAELHRMGYDRLDGEDLVTVAIFKVTPDYIREMEKLGYKDIEMESLVAMRIHDVTGDYVKQMHKAGFETDSEDDLIAWRVHGIDPEYAAEMEKAFGEMPTDDLLAWKIHGVTPRFIHEVRELGYKDIDADRLVAWRIHGVTGDFIHELAELGYKNVDADDLVSMRIHGVTPEWIERLRAKGIDNLSVKDLIKLRISGVEL